jgi:hypothetical protein
MSKHSSASDFWRLSLNLVFALTQIIAGFGFMIFHLGRSIAASSAVAPTPLIPAGYAFSIWGFIFIFDLLYAVYQARPSQRHSHLLRRLGWYTAGAFAFNTVWELVAEFVTFGWPTLLVILIILGFVLAALLALPKFSSFSRAEQWFIFVPVSSLAGWVTAATFANLSSVLYQLNFNNFGLSLSVFSALLLILAGLLAVYILARAQGNFLYGLAVAWALAGIVVANLTQSYHPYLAVLAAGLGTMILIDILFLKYARK